MYYSLSLLATLASFSTAHVILENPKPFRFINYGPSNPIEPTGADFPCKVPSGAQLQLNGAPTVMAIGEEQTASFTGLAVHGGGSCQFSLSGPVPNGAWADYPLKDAEWKVIHSIEGGCPARNQKGNLDSPNRDKYPFKIPNGIEPGDYVFSWTWVPRIGGQPEYYQNCAPITVTPAKGKRTNIMDRRALRATKRVNFPELFMADMGDVSAGCTNSEALAQQLAIAFPNPGPSVDRPEGADHLFKQQCDGNPRAGKPQGDDTDTPHASTVPTPESSTSSSVSSSVTSVAPDSSIVPSSSIATASTSSSATKADPTSSHESCVEGHLTCLDDGVHFATCTGGQLTGPQPIAPGFKCKVGSGVGLEISPA
ncbi:hypothetical protein F5Y04DRAFT_120563 [Hypomontagnella monticulosa]|nr:hypothetical protein F5Y04DRAFT_120563 [Hypomontagnella monticulosa]